MPVCIANMGTTYNTLTEHFLHGRADKFCTICVLTVLSFSEAEMCVEGNVTCVVQGTLCNITWTAMLYWRRGWREYKTLLTEGLASVWNSTDGGAGESMKLNWRMGRRGH